MRSSLARLGPPSFLSGGPLRLLTAALAALLVTAVADVAAAQSEAENLPPLQFVSGIGGEPVRELETSREGYVTLVWTPDPEAAGYRVLDDAGRAVYEGRIRQAFLSGLPDGSHQFRVVSLNDRGEVLREGPQPVTLEVEHWSLALTWTLFGIGAVVMLALVTVLVIGSRGQRKAAAG